MKANNKVSRAIAAMNDGTGTFSDVQAAVASFPFDRPPKPPRSLYEIGLAWDYERRVDSFPDSCEAAFFRGELTREQMDDLRAIVTSGPRYFGDFDPDDLEGEPYRVRALIRVDYTPRAVQASPGEDIWQLIDRDELIADVYLERPPAFRELHAEELNVTPVRYAVVRDLADIPEPNGWHVAQRLAKFDAGEAHFEELRHLCARAVFAPPRDLETLLAASTALTDDDLAELRILATPTAANEA